MARKSRSVRKRIKRRVLFGLELFVLLVLVGGLLIYAKVNEKMNKLDFNDEPEDIEKIEVNEQVVGSKSMKGFTNIALFGVDTRDGNLKSANSDTALIASINNDTKEVKLVSLYRDTYLNIGGDKYTKCNAAYAAGGPTQAISMMNTNLDLDIVNYVAVDFKALATVIDCLGGLDVELSYAEIEHTNNYCVETSEVTGMTYEPIEKPAETPENQDEIIGTYHLNGVQSTAYCRIRYTAGWDMKRTERQRYIISLIVDKAKSASLSTLNDIMDQVFPMVSTNFSKSDLIKLGMGIISYNLGENSGFPFDSMMGENVKNAIGLDCVVPTTLETNVKYLHQFLFGEDDYQPSDTVLSRSDYIAGHTGFGNEYVADERKHLISDRASTYDASADTTPRNSGGSSDASASDYDSYDDTDYSDDSGYSDYSNDYSSDDYNSDDYSDDSYSDDSYNDDSYSNDSYSNDSYSGDDYSSGGDDYSSEEDYSDDGGYETYSDDSEKTTY